MRKIIKFLVLFNIGFIIGSVLGYYLDLNEEKIFPIKTIIVNLVAIIFCFMYLNIKYIDIKKR